MINFEDAKQKRDRGATVKEVIESALNESEDMEAVVIVSKHKNGTIVTGYSWESSLESLGMLDIGKSTIIDEMTE